MDRDFGLHELVLNSAQGTGLRARGAGSGGASEEMAYVGVGPQGRGKGRMLLRLTASSLALAATATVGAEGASAAGALPGSRSRPLRLAELGAEGQLLRGASRDGGAAGLSAGLRDVQQWHAAARRCRPSAARGTELHRLRGGADLGLMAPKPSLSRFTKLQNGLAASRASILWVIKGLLAAFTGLLTTSAVMVAFEFTAHKVRPVTGVRPPGFSHEPLHSSILCRPPLPPSLPPSVSSPVSPSLHGVAGGRSGWRASDVVKGLLRRALLLLSSRASPVSLPWWSADGCDSRALLSPSLSRPVGDDAGLPRGPRVGRGGCGLRAGQLGADKALAITPLCASARRELAVYSSAVYESAGRGAPALVQGHWPRLLYPALPAHLGPGIWGSLVGNSARRCQVSALRVPQEGRLPTEN